MTRDYLHPFTFVLLRVLGALPLFWFLHRTFIKEKVLKKDIGYLFFCALLGVGINQICFFTGLKITTPINASIIMTMTPIMVLISTALLGHESMTKFKMWGIGLGATGALIIILYGNQIKFSQSTLGGDLLILTNASSYGLYLVLIKKMLRIYHPFTVLYWIFLLGLVWIMPFGLLHLANTDWQSFGYEVYLSIAYVIVGVTFLTYLFNGYALSHIKASTVGAYIYLQPLIASFLSLAFGIEKFSWIQALAGALIFIGVFMVSSTISKKILDQKVKISQFLEIFRNHLQK